MGFRYEVLRCMTDNVKTQLKQLLKTHVKKKLKPPPRPSRPPRRRRRPIEPMNVVWDGQGRWKWAIEDDDEEDDDDDNPFGEDWDDDADDHRPS